MAAGTPTIVLVPEDEGVAVLDGTPGVVVHRYDQDGPLPDGLRDAEVVVPPFLGDLADGVLDSLRRLRLVQLLTAGYEAWEGRVPAGVALSSGRGAHGGSTAEWVLAGLLALTRELPRFLDAQRRGEWDHARTGTLLGARAVVVGAGDVAQEITRRLAAFDVTATLVGRRARDGVRGMDELPDLLGDQDVVVLAVPLTDGTRGLVDARFLARMRDGAVLVNAARGPVVDTGALLAELRAGRLRAALDVTDPEPLPDGHPLWSAPGVLITPHVGGSTTGAMRRAYVVAAEQIAAFARGEDPPNLVRVEPWSQR